MGGIIAVFVIIVIVVYCAGKSSEKPVQPNNTIKKPGTPSAKNKTAEANKHDDGSLSIDDCIEINIITDMWDL